MEYEVLIKCGVLHTSKVIKVSAESPEEAACMVKNSIPSSFVVEVNEATND